jgi:hypothetical protein
VQLPRAGRAEIELTGIEAREKRIVLKAVADVASGEPILSARKGIPAWPACGLLRREAAGPNTAYI